MKKRETDERIVLQRRKIQSDAYGILIHILLISIVVQQFFLHAPLAQFAVELFCLIGSSVYITVRRLTASTDIWGSSDQSVRKILVYGFFVALLSVCMLALLAGMQDPVELALYALFIFIFISGGQLLIRYINQKKLQKLNDLLDDDSE